jgi:hypothetical protein
MAKAHLAFGQVTYKMFKSHIFQVFLWHFPSDNLYRLCKLGIIWWKNTFKSSPLNQIKPSFAILVSMTPLLFSPCTCVLISAKTCDLLS